MPGWATPSGSTHSVPMGKGHPQPHPDMPACGGSPRQGGCPREGDMAARCPARWRPPWLWAPARSSCADLRRRRGDGRGQGQHPAPHPGTHRHSQAMRTKAFWLLVVPEELQATHWHQYSSSPKIFSTCWRVTSMRTSITGSPATGRQHVSTGTPGAVPAPCNPPHAKSSALAPRDQGRSHPFHRRSPVPRSVLCCVTWSPWCTHSPLHLK